MYLPNLMSLNVFATLGSLRSDSTGAQPPTQNTGRAPGDYRTVEQITGGPLFQQTFSWSTDPKNPQVPLLEGQRVADFYAQIGGNFNDPKLSLSERADLAANAERVLQFIAQSGGEASTADNNRIEGKYSATFRIDPDFLSDENLSAEGSEARTLLSFARYGYDALQGLGGQDIKPNHRPVV
ncbi:hypothetical protein [Pseudomonas sp. D2002]|uniref:hypothetical protein n=1 Tax=Pseudomonas sp. D2002 TaxID=2726980 RepID=UPI0015A2914B|nr:hypothetical protein [Pseudomonas sp. D2002]NWA85710.1 hypothetical protein [Pseudomonas sp. D2002]